MHEVIFLTTHVGLIAQQPSIQCGARWRKKVVAQSSVRVGARPVPTSRIDWRGVAVLASQGPRAPLQHSRDPLTHHPMRAQQTSRTLSTFHFSGR